MWKAFRTPLNENLEVLRGASFEASAGEMVAIRGASGAGKSTLLHIVGGLEEADRGSVRAGDFDLASARASRLADFRNREIGFVFQFHHLLPDLTAFENVLLPLLISRAHAHKSRRRAHEALERVGLMERARHSVGQLSGGEQQRVAVARALVCEPSIVLADEPTGNLDTQAGEEIGSMLHTYCRSRRAVVVVATHNESLAETCDRVLYLRDGQLSDRQE